MHEGPLETQVLASGKDASLDAVTRIILTAYGADVLDDPPSDGRKSWCDSSLAASKEAGGRYEGHVLPGAAQARPLARRKRHD